MIGMLSPGFPFALLRVHPGLFSRLPYRKTEVDLSDRLQMFYFGKATMEPPEQLQMFSGKAEVDPVLCRRTEPT
jgi:hypothetical protein